MFYAGDVPNSTTDLFVRRCDLGQTWDSVDKRCKHSDGTTLTRQMLQWKDVSTESDTFDINESDINHPAAIHGNNNTATLLADTSGNHPAAEACAALPGGGWYLPSIREIDIIYAHLFANNNDPTNPRTSSLTVPSETWGTFDGPMYCSFRYSKYWSSTEPPQDNLAWRIHFSGGDVWYVEGKTDYRMVRCARR